MLRILQLAKGDAAMATVAAMKERMVTDDANSITMKSFAVHKNSYLICFIEKACDSSMRCRDQCSLSSWQPVWYGMVSGTRYM